MGVIISQSKLKIANVQFEITGDIDTNFRRMARWIARAAGQGAELVHFPETALTGYYRAHVKRLQKIDRKILACRNSDLRALASEFGLWLAYGSTFFAEEKLKPFNSLHLVNPGGEEVCRYDKIFLTDTEAYAYTPGNRLVTVRIKEFKVGLTICFDMRFPELFRRYMEKNVNLLLISSYQAGSLRAPHMKVVASSTLITRAAENGIYVSASNTSEAPSWHEAMIIRFNGQIMAKARRHKPSMALASLDSRDFEQFTDFIRETARESIRGIHPLLNTPLADQMEEIF